MHAVMLAWESISPDGRNTMPAAGPLTWMPELALAPRMTSSTGGDAVLSMPWIIQLDQAVLDAQVVPLVLAQMVTRALRRTASARANWIEAASSSA